jgi:hypothetical protein
MTWVAASVATAEAIAVAEALAVAEAAAAAAAAAETAAATAAAAEAASAASAGITAAETAAATLPEIIAPGAEVGAQGIMQAAPEVANVAAEGSNLAAQQAQNQAVNQGLNRGITQAVDPMAEEIQRLMAEEALKTASTDPGTQFANVVDKLNPPSLTGESRIITDAAGSGNTIPSAASNTPANIPETPYRPLFETPQSPYLAETTPEYINTAAKSMESVPTNSPFMDAYNTASKYVEANKFKTGLGIYGTLAATGALENKGDAPPPKKTFNNPYHFSSDFQGTHPNPNDYQYTPKYPSYAMGGIAGAPPQTNFANPSQSMMGTSQYDMPTDPMSGNIANRMAGGGIADVPKYSRGRQVDVYDASLRFADMMDNPSRYTPPDTRFYSVDTFRDTNPNTATKSPDEAAETRRKAIEQRSYVNTGAKYLPPSRRPGQLDLGPVSGERSKYDNQESILAAQGGIMGYNLGGYASGGNPRLLRGPGDGMSDNIPATIADRQPARLADGEFVVPADVVSHLGNGSTEAGAKKLHEMMNSVRKARTGNPKQGKKINPSKFMPKK